MADNSEIDRNGRWTRRMAQIHVEAQKKSGLSKPVFCQQEGIDYKKLLSWSRKLHLESAPKPNPIGFLPVSIKSESFQNNQAIDIIAKDGHIVRLGANFDTTTLRRVLLALESPC